MAIDAGLALLNQSGYNLAQRHDVRLAPLDVLGRDDVLERLGPVTTLFVSTAAIPKTDPAIPASGFNGHQTGNIHVSLAGRMLMHMLNGLGCQVTLDQLGDFGGDVRFVRFEFAGVVNAGLSPLRVASYLTTAQPRSTPLADRYLMSPEADALVVTDVMQSNTLRILPLALGNTPVRMDLDRLEHTLGDVIEIGMRQDWIECHGAMMATMAFRCFRLQPSRSGWGLALGKDGTPRAALVAPGTRVLVREGITRVA